MLQIWQLALGRALSQHATSAARLMGEYGQNPACRSQARSATGDKPCDVLGAFETKACWCNTNQYCKRLT